MCEVTRLTVSLCPLKLILTGAYRECRGVGRIWRKNGIFWLNPSQSPNAYRYWYWWLNLSSLLLGKTYRGINNWQNKNHYFSLEIAKRAVFLIALGVDSNCSLCFIIGVLQFSYLKYWQTYMYLSHFQIQLAVYNMFSFFIYIFFK